MRRLVLAGLGVAVVGLLGWWVVPVGAAHPARVVKVAAAAPELAPPAEPAEVAPATLEPPTTTTTEVPVQPVGPSPTTTAPPAARPAPPTTARAATVAAQAAPPTTTPTTIAVNEIWVGTGSQGHSGHLGVGQPIWVREPSGHCFQTDQASAPNLRADPTCP